MMTDPIADMLTRIRNAYMSKKQDVKIPFSKVKLVISQIMLNEGYVEKVEKIEEGSRNYLMIVLKYDGFVSAIQSLKRESKPGHRQYKKADEMPKVLNGYGLAIMSTSRGIMSGKEAKKLGIGGELICTLY